MVLDGRSILDKKMVTFSSEHVVDTEDQVQPNGIDLRVNKIYRAEGHVRIPREGKADASKLHVVELEPKDGMWALQPKGIYWADFLEQARVPAEWCGILIGRSSLIRSGVDVEAGLWDTGWNGQLGCSLRVHNTVEIEWGAKLCQILFVKSEFKGNYYTGAYQGTNSQTALVDK